MIAVEVIVAAFLLGIKDGEFQHSVDQSKCNPLAYQLVNLIEDLTKYHQELWDKKPFLCG